MTATITTDVHAAANERALRVTAAIGDGYDTQRKLIELLGMPKTTLLGTLSWLVEQGKIEKVTTEDRKVFYRTRDAFRTADIVRDRVPHPEGTYQTDTAFENLCEVPAWLRKVRPIAPAQATARPAEMPAAARSPRLGKGTQEALVLAYLADHPNDAFGPYELGRALAPAGHKPLGVRDACARLADRGQILRVQNSPVRYRHRPNVREA